MNVLEISQTTGGTVETTTYYKKYYECSKYSLSNIRVGVRELLSRCMQVD